MPTLHETLIPSLYWNTRSLHHSRIFMLIVFLHVSVAMALGKEGGLTTFYDKITEPPCYIVKQDSTSWIIFVIIFVLTTGITLTVCLIAFYTRTELKRKRRRMMRRQRRRHRANRIRNGEHIYKRRQFNHTTPTQPPENNDPLCSDDSIYEDANGTLTEHSTRVIMRPQPVMVPSPQGISLEEYRKKCKQGEDDVKWEEEANPLANHTF
ncbi:unnamed protein product [Phytomonas sp. Hart1]|nr:unnamed protein product [Phytomonas sp. Hart1]|eukprot:CCW72000.1 unnamed protein product [Phytomonas sp. isolate Hart1]